MAINNQVKPELKQLGRRQSSDLSVERSTEYAMEKIFFIVDSRYRSGKPLIVTTNLKLDELKHPPTLTHARIYNPILERCAPIIFSGKNSREDNATRLL